MSQVYYGGVRSDAAAVSVSSFQVSPGHYHMVVRGHYNSHLLNVPHYYDYYSSTPLALTQSMAMDLPLPLKRVSLRVQDAAGRPPGNVAVSAGGLITRQRLGPVAAVGDSHYFNDDPVRTDASGNATMWLFATAPDEQRYAKYAITAVAPPGKPFAAFNVQNVAVTSDKSIFVVLQFLHDPPVTNASVSRRPTRA